eukprot:CAMPEP_0201595774 /NCGR_PEP_ID=MMETSP0190_2-20130828/192665_1 /ASSEMBLY_ACC=CAM_ASM_000263 /TAXON_ID=37353 /ORGANISM="Rosalina sp." /LENGTH=242 /DNA_ID=CAMNT_0048055871 /DNA_START=71 /DNA_END=799 /DNA_ORIENTATION=+
MAEETKSNDESQGFQRDESMIEQYVKMTVDPKQNPIYPKLDEIIQNLGNIKDKICVDVGTGPGIMLPMIDNAVGAKGSIYALDIDKNFLNYTKNKVVPTLKCKDNVTTIESKVDDLCLPKELNAKVDVFMLAFVVNYLQEKERYKQILPQISNYLSKDGVLVILDFDQEFVDATFGTCDENEEENHNDNDDKVGYGTKWKYLEPEQIDKLVTGFGFKFDRFILKNVVPHHHCLVFKKKDPKK